ncbi:hypothetical protein OCEANICA350_11920 [Oceanicaulis sp. 350]|nr:hypothetical protein OCEANICA350_11920 [Oceanicaulis sp. 350]
MGVYPLKGGDVVGDATLADLLSGFARARFKNGREIKIGLGHVGSLLRRGSRGFCDSRSTGISQHGAGIIAPCPV